MALAAALCALLGTAHAAAPTPEPTSRHPRILLDEDLRKAWRTSAGDPRSPVARAIKRCDQIAASPREFDRDGYMGLDWGHHLQACLVAVAATGQDRHATTVMRYFTAMIDDLVHVGDGKGGDAAARRDSGYAIRAMGPYTALAYDWLHDHKLMTEELRRRARQRFAAWTSWYLANGYRARSPATNYQAGYLMAATLIAVAQAGEAGAAGTKLWRHVVDDLWRGDMTKAFAPGGILDGGDWAEGWQYGPLSVAEYALTLRVMRRLGVEIPEAKGWATDLLRRHVHALSPQDKLFVGGDTQVEEPYIEPFVFGLAAIALSDAAPLEVRAGAIAEMDRLGLESRDFLLFDALARGVGIKARPVPRASWPTWYLARGTSTLHARTRWDDAAVWMVVQCSKTLDVDHFQPNAGNFVVSRGKDPLIVDPSPYGSLSTLTGNAPTVDSPQLPDNYVPSQAYWSEATGFRWAHQTQRGVVAARCDYADQYKFQDRPSDVPMAVRDFVLLPTTDGTGGALVIADRADTTSRERKLHLRFRSPTPWKLDDRGATTTHGRSGLALTAIDSSATRPTPRPTLVSPSLRDCFKDSVTRGNCDAARFPVVDYRVDLAGPKVSVTHVLELGDPSVAARGARSAGPTKISGTNYEGVKLTRAAGEAVVVWAVAPREVVVPAAPGAVVVVHDVAAAGQGSEVSAQRAGATCQVTVRPGRARGAGAAVVLLDEDCKARLDEPATTGNAMTAPVSTPAATAASAPGDPDAAPATAPTEAKPSREPAADDATGPDGPDSARPAPRSPRSGCCGASATARSTLPTALLVGLALALRRRRRS